MILVKSWCYYESHILGSHHGLISTYALTTLVLYIFNMFHSELKTPLQVRGTSPPPPSNSQFQTDSINNEMLQVFAKFLQYFSQVFDWDNYCLSVNGPVALHQLPEIISKKGGGKKNPQY